MRVDQLLNHFERVVDSPDSIARLRRFILDLAVHGKLVAQNPDDEPAAKLLKRIAEEKTRLEKAGKNKKHSSTFLVKDHPFPLPPSWHWCQIAEIGTLNPRNIAEDDIPASFVPMRMIPANYGLSNEHEVRQWGQIRKGYTHFAEGDVALAKITPCFENGKSVVFRDLTGGLGSGTTELHIIRPLFVVPEYVLIFLKCPHFIQSGIPKMTGTAGQKRVSTEFFANSPFPLPPIAEQRHIVAKVQDLMVLCDRLEASLTSAEATRCRLLEALFHEALLA